MRLFNLLAVLFLAQLVSAQEKKEETFGDKIMNIQFHYTYMMPEQDLAHRFGTIHNIGFGGLFKTRNHWMFSLDASYQFGSNVKESDLFINLTNSSGMLMNSSGSPADYVVGQRGLSFHGKLGRLFPVSWRNRNSGIVVMLGGGLYYHKINITTTRNDIPMLTDDYKKGYDKLTMGPALTQFIGYYYHSPNRYYNFYIGFDFMQAFTQSVRKFNYDTMLPDTDKRLDMTIGLKVGWMIPIYLKSKNASNEYEFK